MNDLPVEAWDRRPGETPRAYAAFAAYRDMGPTRSLRKLAERSDERASNLRQMATWSSMHDWTDRAGAWDDHVDRESRTEQIEAVRKMREQHATLASAALGKVANRLRTMDADRMSVRDMAHLLDVAVKVERMARGEADQAIDHRGQQAPAEKFLTGEELMQAIADHPELLDLMDGLDDVLAGGG